MSERTFFIGDRNEHGLHPFTMRIGEVRDGVSVEYDKKIADLTDEELASIEQQAHDRRAEAD